MGYLAIQSFGANTAADTAQALQALLQSDPSGIILDLRGNTGGLVSAGMPLLGPSQPPQNATTL